MPGQRILLFIVAQALFAGFAILLANSPYRNMSVSPTGSQPWADGPMKLVTTPQYETKKVSQLDSSVSRCNWQY
jgi:hypothetical protein